MVEVLLEFYHMICTCTAKVCKCKWVPLHAMSSCKGVQTNNGKDYQLVSEVLITIMVCTTATDHKGYHMMM